MPGYASTITPDYSSQHQDDAIFGKYDLHNSTHTGRLNRLTLNYAPFDIEMIERGMLLPNGAGTAEEYLTFIEGTLINNVLLHRLNVGSIITSQSGQINRGSFRMTHVYEVSEVSDWVADHGLTSYNFVNFNEIPESPSWSHLSPDEDPCELNGTITDVSDFRCRFDRYTQAGQAGANAFATETISGICLGGVTIDTI
jgi:hypothetical protein